MSSQIRMPNLIVTSNIGLIHWFGIYLARHLEATTDRSPVIPERTTEGLRFIVRGRPGSGENAETVLLMVPVNSSPTADEVKGRHIWGDLPWDLAQLAATVTKVVYTRGRPQPVQEVTLSAFQMMTYGAVLGPTLRVVTAD